MNKDIMLINDFLDFRSKVSQEYQKRYLSSTSKDIDKLSFKLFLLREQKISLEKITNNY